MAEIAIDLGTANTLIHVRGEGIVVNEPSVVALERSTGKVLAVGLEAKRMLGRTPENVVAVSPMRGGVIADVDRVDLMLRHFLQRVLPRRRLAMKPRVLITIPSGITEMERRAVREGVIAAGARQVYMLSEPIAAAIGAGLPVTTPRGSMVVNVGGGTTEIGVVALSGIVANTSIRVAGQDLDELIVAYIRRTHNLLVGESTAEVVKIRIGSAYPNGSEQEMPVKGRDLVSGFPRTVQVNSAEVRECIREPLQAITAAVRQALEITPPELASDIMDEGIVMTGGGVQLRGMGALLADDSHLPIRFDDEPLTTVVRGAGAVLDDWKEYRDTLIH
ncbi:MAG TPA: rod shape-determining protein [Longimicrobiaceae bacterium]|nr:rod shape-determining protein [Longimicrobiaceae bacterium]